MKHPQINWVCFKQVGATSRRLNLNRFWSLAANLRDGFNSNEMHPNQLWQVESADKKDGHLGAGDGTIGTICAVAATAGYSFVGKLLDPGGGPMGGRNIIEHDSGGRGWVVACAMSGLEQEDSHLSAGNGAFRAVVVVATAASDTVTGELFDPRCRPVRDRHIPKDTALRRGR